MTAKSSYKSRVRIRSVMRTFVSPVEVFFRESKQKLGFDQYQIRSSQGIKRFWLLMSLAHFLCCTGEGKKVHLRKGMHIFKERS